MRHDIRLKGYAFSLRPVELSDAPLIVSLRTDTDRTRYLHRIPLDVAAQKDYLKRYFHRDGDYYFVIDRVIAGAGRSEGLVGIYDVDITHRRAEWGRWVLHPRSLAAIESAWLIYRVGFERLGLDEMYCRTLVDNGAVLSFHDKAGLVRSRRLTALDEIDGQQQDTIEHVLTRGLWLETSSYLAARAKRLAPRLNGRR